MELLKKKKKTPKMTFRMKIFRNSIYPKKPKTKILLYKVHTLSVLFFTSDCVVVYRLLVSQMFFNVRIILPVCLICSCAFM